MTGVNFKKSFFYLSKFQIAIPIPDLWLLVLHARYARSKKSTVYRCSIVNSDVKAIPYNAHFLVWKMYTVYWTAINSELPRNLLQYRPTGIEPTFRLDFHCFVHGLDVTFLRRRRPLLAWAEEGSRIRKYNQRVTTLPSRLLTRESPLKTRRFLNNKHTSVVCTRAMALTSGRYQGWCLDLFRASVGCFFGERRG